MGFGKINDAELVAQHGGNVHLGKGTRRYGYAIFSSDLSGLHITRFSTAKQYDGIVLTALTGLTDNRQTGCGHMTKLLTGLNRPIPVRRCWPSMEIPFNVLQQMFDVEVFHP
jgi:hypothetical protein